MIANEGPYGWTETSPGLFQRMRDKDYPLVPCPYCGKVLNFEAIPDHAQKDHEDVSVHLQFNPPKP